MTEFKFQWQKFKMESSAKDFLEKYVSRIKKYAESHNISDDLVDDIQQSVLEKLLDEKWEITQKKIVKIVNSIWEPEDIFEEDAEIEMPKEEKKSKQKYKPMFLWVCAWLAELMKIPVWAVRVLFFFLIFTYTFGIWLYLVIFLIRFVTDRQWASDSISSRIKRIVSRIWDRIRRLYKTFFHIIKRAFLICWSLFLIFIIVCLWVFLYYLCFGFVKWNIDYTTIFPWITKLWVIFWIISAFILLLVSIGSMIKKKLSNTTSLVVAIGCGLLAVIIAIITIFHIYTTINLMTWSERKEIREKEIAITNPENPVHINVNRIIEWWDILITENRFVSVLPSDNDKIKVVYTFNFKWKWEELAKAVENISDIDYSWNWDILNIWLKNSEIFSKVTPFTPTTIDIDLYLPKDLDFDFKNSGIRLINFEFPFSASSQASVSVYDCEDINYNEETNKFYCKLAMDRNHKSSILEWNLKWMADDIVPLKWTNSVRSEVREWKDSRLYDPYRRFDSMKFYNDTREDNRVLVKYSDKFFNFFIDVEYDINPNTAEFTFINSILRDVEQKWRMNLERMKYYEWREKLSDYEIEMEVDSDDN